MTFPIRGLVLAFSLVLVSSFAFPPKAKAQSTSSTAAHVYVQVGGRAGAVYGLNASSTGQLSAIPGSPFKLGTEIIGGNKTQFLTLGDSLLHSYGVASNGAIQSQLSQISLMDYSGGSCGDGKDDGDGAVLDHTGKYIYVLLQNAYSGSVACAAYQSYIINSDGSFVFDGDTEITSPNETGSADCCFGLPSILGSESFAYSNYMAPQNYWVLSGFRRESSGTLDYLPDFTYTPPPVTDGYNASWADASPTGNYAVLALSVIDQAYPAQLGSFTVNSEGNLTTTNTSSNMPSTKLTEFSTTFSPSGNFFVAYGTAGGTNANGKGGIEIYNFNGAAPLTLYKTALEGTPINQVVWDSSNHMYAISTSENMLYVFTVTPTSVTEDSSWSIGAPYSMVVVSETPTCSAPTTNGVNVCSPAEGATVTSPVSISAAATVSGGVYRFSLWNGATKLLNEDNGVMNGSVSLAPGTYKLIFDAVNSSGVHADATRDITVK
jgi:hypothetical protein